MAAGGTVAKTPSTKAATSAPGSGLISSFDFRAAATNWESDMVAMNALRSAPTRSAARGTAGRAAGAPAPTAKSASHRSWPFFKTLVPGDDTRDSVRIVRQRVAAPDHMQVGPDQQIV